MDLFAPLGAGVLVNTISALIWLFIIYLVVAPRVKLAAKVERRNDPPRYRVGYWNAGRQKLLNVQFRAWVRWREDSRVETHELQVDEAATRIVLPRHSESSKELLIVYPVFQWSSLNELCRKRGNTPFKQGDLNLLPDLMAARDGREEASLIATVTAVHPLSGFQRVVRQIYGPSDFFEVNEKVKTGRHAMLRRRRPRPRRYSDPERRQPETGRELEGAVRIRRYLVAALFMITIVIVVTLTLMMTIWNVKPDTLPFEIAKTLLQIAVVAVVGVAISQLTDAYQQRRSQDERKRDRDREAVQHTREVLTSTLEQATATYNAIKRARRLIRALARSSTGPGRDAYAVLSGPYDAQMLTINDSQLKFEMLADDVATDVTTEKMFSTPEELIELFNDLESYLGNLITEYEKCRPKFTGRPEQIDLQSLKELSKFLDRESSFDEFADAFRDVRTRLRADIAATYSQPVAS